MTSTNEYLSAEALATGTSYVKICYKPPSPPLIINLFEICRFVCHLQIPVYSFGRGLSKSPVKVPSPAWQNVGLSIRLMSVCLCDDPTAKAGLLRTVCCLTVRPVCHTVVGPV